MKKHGKPTTTDLVELLGCMDVKTSTQLPSLDDVTKLIASINAAEKPSYDELTETVKKGLPDGCVLDIQGFTATKTTGDLKSLIKELIPAIVKEIRASILIPNKDSIITALDSEDAPQMILDNLDKIDKIAKESPMLLRVFSGQIKPIMINLYNSKNTHAYSSIGVKGPMAEKLKRIFSHELKHNVRTESDFTKFIKQYADETVALTKTADQLAQINKQSPNTFQKMLDCLDQSPMKGEYNLATLANVLEAFAEVGDTVSTFSLPLFKLFFPKSKDETLTQHSVEQLCFLLFNTDNAALQQITLTEKEKLGQLAIAHLKVDGNHLNKYFEKLIALKAKSPAYYERLLTILTDLPANIGHIETLENIIAEQPQRFAIAMKASQEADSNAILSLIDKLNALDTLTLNKLDSLYKLPTYPDLKALNEALDKKPINIDTFITDFDLKPRKESDIITHFDTKSVIDYIDGMQDLNYERPLLLTQRKELQAWFLYVNAIGHKCPLPKLGDYEAKPVKDMLHGEITARLDHYRTILQNDDTSDTERTRARLDCIAILREVMYRRTGQFPRPTQIFYLLTAMQNNENDSFVAQIKTGQGKSLTSGLAAALLVLEGYTVDVTTKDLPLANEGFESNQSFYDYLGIPSGLITASASTLSDYKLGGIHYSSTGDMALFRSHHESERKHLAKKCAIVGDEIDYSALDDNVSYRRAVPMDQSEPGKPFESPYIWIYEAMISFKTIQTSPLTDDDLTNAANAYLNVSVKNPHQKEQLKALQESPDYNRRLKTWLRAAAQTEALVEQEEIQYRIEEIQHPGLGVTFSKACKLTAGNANQTSEYGNAVQPFLHVRLKQKYAEQIQDGTMPDFFIEPEKTYLATMNARIFLDRYLRRWGMSGTVGSSKERIEQHNKTGTRFVDIPSFQPSNRIELLPILTNPKLLNDAEKEETALVKNIAKEVIRSIKENKGDSAPILINCPNKAIGNKIATRINKELLKQGLTTPNIQEFYDSNDLTKASIAKDNAGKNNAITISTVFSRGTDIKPTHPKGLYTILTHVDTKPYSAEDIERSVGQVEGRSGRAGQVGYTRFLLARSQFTDAYPNDPRALKRLSSTPPAVREAIRRLNEVRNGPRAIERMEREAFEGVHEFFYQKALQAYDHEHLVKDWIEMRTLILEHQSDQVGSFESKLNNVITFACEQWNAANKDDTVVVPDDVKKSINANRHTLPEKISSNQHLGELDRALLEEEVYLKMSPEPLPSAILNVVIEKINIHHAAPRLKISSVNDEQLGTKLSFIVLELLSKRYKTSLAGNHSDYNNGFSKQYKKLVEDVMWSNAPRLINSMVEASLIHVENCYRDERAPLQKKTAYLQSIMSELKPILKAVSSPVIASVSEATQDFVPPNDGASVSDKDMTTTYPSFRDNCDKSSSRLMTHQLNAYQNQWWSYLTVSSDRKALAKALISTLKAEKAPSLKDKLMALNETRKALLQNDLDKNRNLASGLEGRLNRYLDSYRLQLIAVSTPDELDSLVGIEFEDINNVLEIYTKKYPKTNEAQNMFPTLSADPLYAKEAYTAFKDIISNIESEANLDENVKNTDLQVLRRYCREKQSYLEKYFEQCDVLAFVNDLETDKNLEESELISQIPNLAERRQALEPTGAKLQQKTMRTILECEKMNGELYNRVIKAYELHSKDNMSPMEPRAFFTQYKDPPQPNAPKKGLT